MPYLEYNQMRVCTNFWHWLNFGWNFVNRFGIREWGLRILGISISNFREQIDE